MRFCFALACLALNVGSVVAGGVWPFPGVSLPGDLTMPSQGKGVALLDVGLPTIERSSVYGLSSSLVGSCYSDMMVGAQLGVVSSANEAYGVQIGLAGTKAGRGFGAQVGFVNIYDDESFRVQLGFINSHVLSLNWNYGPVQHSGGCGVQAGFLNLSSEGCHSQFGVFNVGWDSTVVQFGLFNFAYGSSKCFQIGLVNKRADDASPLIGWKW